MSDTVMFGRTFSGSLKACLLYTIATVGVDLVKAMSMMQKQTWDEMWWMPRTGFWLGFVVSGAITIKAFYSNSSPNPQQKN